MLTRAIDATEQRVLGALMEKERTTPEGYPLTLNAVLAACNQKTNREPVTELTEEQVIDALERLRRDALAWRTQGARVERWEHRLGSRWRLDDAGEALITLLLLRGPQTPGELRSRSERLRPFGTVAEVEEALHRLADGPEPLVRELPRVPGQRESRWAHVMGTEPPVVLADAPVVIERRERPASASVSVLEERVARLEARVAQLEERLARER
ncbi:MAG TPA: YceH family protein [Thermoanaerobaculia bacterium]|nr:YceH family protein [Thermoanaerobaculia bacterium]